MRIPTGAPISEHKNIKLSEKQKQCATSSPPEKGTAQLITLGCGVFERLLRLLRSQKMDGVISAIIMLLRSPSACIYAWIRGPKIELSTKMVSPRR